MSIELYGSITSPYVRRIRMLLDGQDHEFRLVNIYDENQRTEFSKISPIRKLPVLKVDDTLIYESGVIADYLLARAKQPALTIEQNNLISAVNAATDSFVIILQSKNSGLTVDEQKMFYGLQASRIKVCLDWLEEQAKAGEFNEWNYATMALISLFDWATFRELQDFSSYPCLGKACSAQADREIVQSTMPS